MSIPHAFDARPQPNTVGGVGGIAVHEVGIFVKEFKHGGLLFAEGAARRSRCSPVVCFIKTRLFIGQPVDTVKPVCLLLYRVNYPDCTGKISPIFAEIIKEFS